MIRTLTDADFADVHRAFNEAFSDYVVKLSLTPEQLRDMMARRGYLPAASVAAFAEGRIVAFALNGLDRDASRAVITESGRLGRSRRASRPATIRDRAGRLITAGGTPDLHGRR